MVFYKGVYKMQSIKISLVFLFFLSCAETKIDTTHGNADNQTSPVSVPKLSPQERADIAINPVFEAVVDNQTPEYINRLLSQSTLSIQTVNKKGDTVLGTALKLKNPDMALFLLEKFTCADLSHQNNKGESYVYLSAKHGYEELIHNIAKKCFENSFWWPDYEFSDLDPKTDEGETAIHVALNGATARALNEEYDRGTLEYNWFPFLGARNNKGESFVHTAVQDNRLNTVEWAVDVYCRKGDWERSKNRLKSWPVAVGKEMWHGLQGYTWNFFNIDQIFNKQDKQGQTALHLSSKALNIKAIKILSNCRWLDFLMEDKRGNIALQTFLSALDPHKKNYSKEIKDTFVLLAHQRNYMTTHITRTVDHQNNKGDSAFHISARLSDPFFYNYLIKYGDKYLKNEEEQAPKDIWTVTQNKLDQIGS